jgi:hypothetical protein
MFKIVNPTEVHAHLEVVGLKGRNEREVLLSRGITAQIRTVSLTGKDAWGGRGGKGDHFGVPILTATGTSGVQGLCCGSIAKDRPSVRRFINSPVRICSCNVRMACIKVSGLGGQPGA